MRSTLPLNANVSYNIHTIFLYLLSLLCTSLICCALCFHDENVNIRQNERMQEKTPEKKGRTEQNSQRLCDDFITIVENRPTIVYVHLSYVCNIGRCCWRLYCILLTTGAIIGTSFSLLLKHV